MLWSIFSVSNEILVIQSFTTSFWCLLTKRQGPWGRFCSWKILPWKLAAHKLMRLSQKGGMLLHSMSSLNLGSLSKLIYRLLWNSAEKKTDSSSSHPEGGCQTAEAAEGRPRVVSWAKAPASRAPASVTASAHQGLIIAIAAKSPQLSYRDPGTANLLLEEERLQGCPAPGPGISLLWGDL